MQPTLLHHCSNRAKGVASPFPLYRWREAFRRGGELAVRPHRGRPRKGAALAMAAARRQIAALERKVGQQQLELDFSKQALRHIEALRPADANSTTRGTLSEQRPGIPLRDLIVEPADIGPDSAG